MATPNLVPLQVSPAFQAMRRLVAAGAPEPERMEELLHALDRERRLEQAWLLLRLARPDPARWGPWPGRMKALLEQDRVRRMNVWQTDPDRATLRLAFALRAPACRQNPAGVISLLAWALLDAGVPLAVGLEKALRPAIHLAHPLPPMVPGDWEWADAILAQGAGLPAPDLVAAINAHAAPGLRIRQCQQLPNHASPAAELCRRAHWRWACPEAWVEGARARLDAFLASERFELEKTGKIEGLKGAKVLDIRPLVEACRWDGSSLHFQTPLAAGGATNPRKLLAAILGREVAPEELERTGVELGEDPRLVDPDRYQPKLHNMFEDAVPLGAGDRIQIVEDDDDEPLRLG